MQRRLKKEERRKKEKKRRVISALNRVEKSNNGNRNHELVKRICMCICKSHGGSTAARINRFAFIYDRLVGAFVSKLYVRGLLVRKKYSTVSERARLRR